MQVTQITVNAGRTLQHPCETYANIRPEVALTATLEPGEDPIEATRKLQRQAEQLVEEHSMVLKAWLMERNVARREVEEIGSLTQSLTSGQGRLEVLKGNASRRAQGNGLLFDSEPVPADY